MKTFIGFEEALSLTLSGTSPLPPEIVPLKSLAGRILNRDALSEVDSPSADVSLKDGFAVVAKDLAGVDKAGPVRLCLCGGLTAGETARGTLGRGEAFRITTGAPLPQGADAVLSEEFSRREGDKILCLRDVQPGQNVLSQGTDIQRGEIAARKGEQISAAAVGLLASAGVKEAEVVRVPRVTVVGTGDEVVAPGHPLAPGKLYASNVLEICGWLSMFGISFDLELVGDRTDQIMKVIERHLPGTDAFITSGGIWGSERDLMMQALDASGWEGVYRRVRMGPGKAVSFGLLEGRPFFCLPGGPPSNEMAFLQLALPGILAMQGRKHLPFPKVTARLEETVRGEKTWTQFIHAKVTGRGGEIFVRPLRLASRLRSMAEKDALIVIPEGKEAWEESELIPIQLLVPLVEPHELLTRAPLFHCG